MSVKTEVTQYHVDTYSLMVKSHHYSLKIVMTGIDAEVI